MTEAAAASKKKPRKQTSIYDDIEKLTLKLKQLKETARAQEKKEKEQTQKAVLAMISAEGLDQASIEKWKEVLPQLKKLLGVGDAPAPAAVE